jgi:hypothetical protein
MEGVYPCHRFSAKKEVLKVFPNARCLRKTKWHYVVVAGDVFLAWGVKQECAWKAWDAALGHIELMKSNNWTKEQLIEFLPEVPCCDSPGKDKCEQCQEIGLAYPYNH